MKTIYSILSVLMLASCGKLTPKGEVEQKQIPLTQLSKENFTGISAKGKFRVFWVNSPENLVEIETYPNFIDNLEMNIKDNTLNINEKRETKGLGFYNITIFSKSIPKNISLSDSIEFNVSGKIAVEDFSLKLKDNAKFIGAIQSEKTAIEMENLSLANLQGFTKEMNFKIKDTAGVIAPYFIANTLDINAENGSYSEFTVKDTVKGNIKNTAKFSYYDTPFLNLKKDKTTTIKNIEK